MALSQSALSELLDAFRTGDGVNLIRESVRMVMQELIETEATEQIGAGRYERTEARTTERNGARSRLVATQAGDVQLRIPKLRKGSFYPSILEPRRRIDQALYAVVMEAYVHGVSTRSVDDLVAALGIDSGISKSEVSRICAGLDEVVGAFRTRSLDHTAFPYVYLDATYLHVRNSSSQVTSMAVVVATGITAEGAREVLGLDVGDSEDEVFWRGFLASLKKRGLSGVRLVISDQHAGLVAALRRSFQGSGHQRCRVHFARNLLAHVPKSHSDMVAAVFRTIFAQPDPATAASTWDEVRDQLAGRFPKIGPLMDQAKAEVLAFSTFPRAHWSKIWSTNPLERVNKEIKRRARVVGIFPNEAAVIRLVGAVLADMHDEWQSGERRYLSEGSMALLDPSGDTGTIAAINRGE
ncbi:IS256 family transposase [Rhodococcus opacus]|jgi:transposase-like protein|uniref:Mutator family transposase n=1 Tax=Rhodococcus koreensis TaxID=99653 RepID=A0A1H4L9U7_9NOCA|nr:MULTISPECIES: IS256 family transposase [Rhodococcus]MBA8963727.1 transposase-like protein [Rhodococcus opacus]MBP2207217.1 transposase-like protein [Rhodococcus opacus]UNN02060.1 IS256 family transposase [Rhodococcus opacus]UNN03891.1 IS256 family transposase [Rhodococcus opacus]UZG52798.1 IS256 family transposase [Rhodococcus opacus]